MFSVMGGLTTLPANAMWTNAHRQLLVDTGMALWISDEVSGTYLPSTGALEEARHLYLSRLRSLGQVVAERSAEDAQQYAEALQYLLIDVPDVLLVSDVETFMDWPGLAGKWNMRMVGVLLNGLGYAWDHVSARPEFYEEGRDPAEREAWQEHQRRWIARVQLALLVKVKDLGLGEREQRNLANKVRLPDRTEAFEVFGLLEDQAGRSAASLDEFLGGEPDTPTSSVLDAVRGWPGRLLRRVRRSP